MTPRIVPALDDVNRAFWTGGRTGELVLEHCAACDRWQHPPSGRCEACHGEVTHRAASGRGRVLTFTVNEHQYHPEVPPPYVIALVELDEQPDLRIPTNIVGCDPAQVTIGMPVHVAFDAQGDVFVPVFEPEGHQA